MALNYWWQLCFRGCRPNPLVSRLAELGFEWMRYGMSYLDAWWHKIQNRKSFSNVFEAFSNLASRKAMKQAGEDVREDAIRILYRH